MVDTERETSLYVPDGVLGSKQVNVSYIDTTGVGNKEFHGGLVIEWQGNGGSVNFRTVRYGITRVSVAGGNNANIIVKLGGVKYWEITTAYQDGAWHNWANTVTLPYHEPISGEVTFIFDRSGAGDPQRSASFTF